MRVLWGASCLFMATFMAGKAFAMCVLWLADKPLRIDPTLYLGIAMLLLCEARRQQ